MPNALNSNFTDAALAPPPCREVVAFIPARGGSKGIPRKNIRELCGKPLIAYSIEVALRARRVDRVVVSTDDPEIAEIARAYGAETPFLRPAELSGDHANIGAALDYTLDRMYDGRVWDVIAVSLYPTHPFRTPALLDELIAKTDEGYNRVETVRGFGISPLSLMRADPADGRLAPLVPADSLWCAADAALVYRTYGLVFISRACRHLRPYFHVIRDKVGWIDIDEEADLRLAEAVVANGLFDFGGAS